MVIQDVATGELACETQLHAPGKGYHYSDKDVIRIAWSPDSRLLASGGEDSKVRDTAETRSWSDETVAR